MTFEDVSGSARNEVVEGRGKRKKLVGQLKEPFKSEFSWLRDGVEF